MGSNTMRKVLAKDNRRQASSSVDLVADKEVAYDMVVEAAVTKGHNAEKNGMFKGRSKSFASGLSNKVTLDAKDKTGKQSDNKPKTKVQRFLLQLRSLVVKDNPKTVVVKDNPKTDGNTKTVVRRNIENELSVTEDKDNVNRTVIKIRNSIIRSKSQKHSQAQTPTKRLKPSHQSTPRLL